jgi:hypothetical protein
VPSEEHDKFAHLLFRELSQVWERARPEDVRAYSETYPDMFNREDNSQRRYPIRAARALARALQGQGEPTFTIEMKDLSKELALATRGLESNDAAGLHIQLRVLRLVAERWLEMGIRMPPETVAKALKNGWAFKAR